MKPRTLITLALVAGFAFFAVMTWRDWKTRHDIPSRAEAEQLADQWIVDNAHDLNLGFWVHIDDADMSMGPGYNRRIAIIDMQPFDLVRTGLDGDVVVFLDELGRYLIHRAVARNPDGSMVARGDNNPRPDRTLITRQNYMGIEVHRIQYY
jgi:hypothetical protein